MNNLISTQDLVIELRRISDLLTDAHKDLVARSYEYAKSERDYRRSKAVAYHAVREEKMVAAEREAKVDAATSDDRYKRDLAESLKVAALEQVRSLRGQLSATQTIASSVKSEMEMAGR